jgi:hypothetical protein
MRRPVGVKWVLSLLRETKFSPAERSSPFNPSLFGSLEKLGDCLLDQGLIVYIRTRVWKTHVLPPNSPLELRNHPAVSGIQDVIGPVACWRIVSVVSAGRTR